VAEYAPTPKAEAAELATKFSVRPGEGTAVSARSVAVLPEFRMDNQNGTVVGSTTKGSDPFAVGTVNITGAAEPAVLGRAKEIDTEAGAAVSGDPGGVVACAKPAHRRSADAAREILFGETLNMN